MTTSLWRNREFNLLWTSQTLSDLGDGVATLALALLVLVQTGDPVSAGLVGTLASVAQLVFRLPAGIVVDRFDRRLLMLTCDSVRLLAFTVLTVAVFTGHASLPLIIAAATIDAACGALFSTAEDASLRSIVPIDQLPDAVARNEARSYGAMLAGPPLGGLLFSFGQAIPFLGNAISYLFSLLMVGAIRKPLQAPRDEDTPVKLSEGIRFVLTHPFLRMLMLIAAPLNFAIGGVIFAVIVALQRGGTAPAVIGLTETVIAVGGLLGALAAPAIQRRLGLPALVRTICWLAVALLAGAALLTSSIAAAIPLALTVFVGPACNAALFGYQAAITPDHLQGRVISVIMMAATSMAALAPVVAGSLVAAFGAPVAILFFAGAVAVSAFGATFGTGLSTAGRTDRAPALTE
ncbi:MFS transporter [Paractinoplanes atraurantiacus]|uniref:Predicted arabinose efflux permease, MFS family n=1 Tax=Paractinoplanes atraurantiacus TaxID=1036182 RepID=A0A285K7N5_9ACTN|nr:MFS transporter [Actinoplanes atraurantiacus]SNY68589.1 Predicted arabinose efflux permease, MFS family [Actinoplanes atraurantiacus]